MKLIAFDIFSYEVPLDIGMNRKGFIIRLADESGKEGFGEVAPLPGLSHETLEEALSFLRSLREKILQKELSPTFFPPSVMFGMESAVSQLYSPLTEDLSFTTTRFFYDPKEATPIGGNVKIKLGSYDLSQAISIAKRFIEKGAKLRIDLNRKWSLKETKEFCRHFSCEEILYIEEPVQYFMELEAFHEETGFFYALDEHLLFHPLERILKLKGLSHLIVKPSIHGGLDQCKAIQLAASNVECVFSTSFETDIGLSHIVRISSKINPNKIVAIDTYQSHKYSLLKKPIPFRKGLIKKELFNHMSVDYSNMVKV